jgi:hemerythrin-like domain-containing protein
MSQPTQVFLPGQTHVADGPHDQTGMYVMHHALRRDLARFESAVRATPVGDATTWRALQDRWGRFAETLHHHHSIEDRSFWPILVRHVQEAGDTEGLATLRAMEDEHAEIDPALSAATGGFADMVEHPCADHRNALDVHVTTTRAALLDHLRHEETDALPLLQRVMTTEEYAACEDAANKGYPLRSVPFLLPWATAGLPDDVTQSLLGGAGAPYRLALRLLRGRFERAEATAFRYV